MSDVSSGSGVGVYFQSLPTWWTPTAMGADGCIEAGRPLSLDWNEQNTGGADASYSDDIYVDGTRVDSISLSLAAGAVQERTYTVDAGVSAGNHTVIIVINSGDAVAEGFTQQTINLCGQ